MKPTPQTQQPAQTGLAQSKLAIKMFGPTISTRSARKAAIKVAENLAAPSVVEFVAQPYLDAKGATLCGPQMPAAIISAPTSLFGESKLSVSEVPDGWMATYSEWMARLQRAHEFRTATLHLDCATKQTPPIEDPIVAGLLLYLHSGSVDLDTRAQWLQVAIGSPVGSWLAAEGLHTRDECPRILNGVRSDSRLLFAVSQIAGFGVEAAKLAQSHLDVYGGLILACHGTSEQLETWLRRTALAACECADAASAAMILQPSADDRDKSVWLSTLKNPKHARYAFEAVHLAKHTWPEKEWNQLKNALREYAVSDSSQWTCHWFTAIEPQHATSALGTEHFDLLWAAELLAQTNVNDYAFRFRLGEQLGGLNNSPAAIVLTWLNQRHALKSNGTL